MARARNIKPGFFSNDELVELPFETRLLFIGLWTIADREGRLLDRPKKIKMDIFPGDSVEVDACLGQLAASGFIDRYEAAGTRAIQIVNWDKHQNPHVKEAPSTIPARGDSSIAIEQASDEHQSSTVQAPEIPERAGLIPDSGYLIPDSGLPSGAAVAPQAPQAPQAPTPKRSTDASASRLPADWEPDTVAIAFCQTERPDLQPQEVAARFRDYWIAQPGTKGKKTDWPATWRNWVRNEKQQARASPRQAQQANTQTLLNRIQGKPSHVPDPRIIDVN